LKAGYRIVDTDTHVVPAMELLHHHGSDELRRRWPELAPYLATETSLRTDLGDYDHPYTKLSFGSYGYDRPFGAKTPDPDWRKKLAASVKRLPDGPELGVWHDNAAGRLRAMDREGVDRHLVIPGTFAMTTTVLDTDLAVELLAAYNRYVVAYCDADPVRLTAAVQVTGADPEWSAAEIKRVAAEQCVGAATVVLPQAMAVDDPDLHPIWQALDEADLPLLHHSFFIEPPYFPGYRDIWGNAIAARAAAHPWGAQRLVAYLILGGLFDRYPRLRLGFAECGAGWLPSWLYRLRGQMSYLRAAVPAGVGDPLDYVHAGRIYVGVEFYEDEALVRSMIDVIGDDALMWQSDFPHPQCNFPTSPDPVLAWTRLGRDEKRKLLADNADRYLRAP
jgi:predicted TIM-barrel fold metal-dependent hydrolase